MMYRRRRVQAARATISGRALACTRSQEIVTRFGSGRSARQSWHTTRCDSSSCISSPGRGKRLQLEQRADSALARRAVRLRNDARSLAMDAEFVRIRKIPAHGLEHSSGSLPFRRNDAHHFTAMEVSAPKPPVMIRTMLGREPLDTFNSGTLAGAGCFRCEECGFAVALHERDEVPACPHCAGTEFRRSSIFGDLNVTQEPLGPNELGPPGWLSEAREALDRDGLYLAFEDSSLRVVSLLEGWTRIGRSLSADLRFDDPTVSRRHAMLHRERDNVRILDDRSLNGVFVNGDRVDMRPLQDGDQVTIGRFDLYFLILRGTGAPERRRARGAVA